jgi:SAM-dependent methyltransferase
MNGTLNFYKNNAKKLITKYDNAELIQLHSIFKQYINTKDKVLDIGFGSGRDLKFIYNITPNIFGLDSCDFFVKNMENNGFKGRVSTSILPDINIDKFEYTVDGFDIVISIAVFMHLSILEIERSIENIKKILNKNGVIIISYSLQRQVVDERHFESLNQDMIMKIFKKLNLKLIEQFQSNDGLNRKIQWVTQVFQLA